MKKKTLLIFHPVLATYRVDQFNSLNDLFNLKVVFLFDNMWNYRMDQDKLISECNFEQHYLLKGIKLKGRVFRFGVYRMIKEINPDIIISYEYSLTTQYIILLKKLGLIKQNIGITTDDSIDFCHNVQSLARQIIRNSSLSKLSFIVVLSDEVSKFYKNKFQLKDNQVIISPILQSSEKLRKESHILEEKAKSNIDIYKLKNKKVLLFVGRLIPEKALEGFFQTTAQLISDYDNIVFVIVGEGKEKSKLQDVINKKSLNNKIIFTGKLEGSDVHSWYLSASGFVLPSISEAFGAVVNEALIFGIPVLCSKYAGASSLINKKNGLIFDPLEKGDTVAKTRQFFDNIHSIEEVSIDNKPSLMEDLDEQFINEWEKLQYV